MSQVTVGVIGCNGRIGKLHTETIVSRLPECKIKYVCDMKLDDAQALARRLGIPKCVSNHQEILRDPEINAVLICTPTPTHVPYIIEAAKAGKHIFCEKPVDLSPERIVDAIKAAKDNKVKLQIGFMKRFDPEFTKLREKVRGGAVGDQYVIRFSSRDAGLPSPEYVKTSGGIFKDMTIHDFDLLRFITGSEVDEVFVFGAVRIADYFREAKDVDTAIVSFRLQNGALGCIDNSRKTNYGYDQRVEVFGSNGCAMAEHVKHSQIVVLNDKGIIVDNPKDWFMDRYSSAYVEEMRQFLSVLASDQEPPVTAMDGLRATLIAVAAQKSADEKKPVKVDYSLCGR